jgi:hypothetical protein
MAESVIKRVGEQKRKNCGGGKLCAMNESKTVPRNMSEFNKDAGAPVTILCGSMMRARTIILLIKKIRKNMFC